MDIENIHYVEAKYDLLNKDINGFKYWVYCREEIVSIFINSCLYGAGYHSRRKSDVKNIVGDIWALFSNTITKGFIRNEKSDIVFLNHERRVWNGSNYECIYTDDLVNYYNALAI